MAGANGVQARGVLAVKGAPQGPVAVPARISPLFRGGDAFLIALAFGF